MSTIETLAYLEYGDVPNNFQQFLNAYFETIYDKNLWNNNAIITPQELWELRNAIIHTSTIISRKVKNQQTLPITIFFNISEKELYQQCPQTSVIDKIMDFDYFMTNALINAISLWIKSYDNPEKTSTLIGRCEHIMLNDNFSL